MGPLISNTRLYGAAIAIVSGVYSIASPLSAVSGYQPMGGMNSGMGSLGVAGWVMLLVGVVVLVHGVALLTPIAASMANWSGRLMLLWAAIMLLDQAYLWAGANGSLPAPTMVDMTWDPGMVAVAVLMVISGLIMLPRRGAQ